MSFDIALSGIQAINNQLNTISNNIANSGTYGFKSGRANFSSMYAGTQPTGTEIGSLTQSIGLSGGVLNTGRSLDAAINGRGFFVSRDSTGAMLYSRVGIFSTDKSGYLVDSAGRKVQGYGVVPGSTTLGPMGDLKVPTGQIPAQASTKMDYVGNLSADWTVPPNAAFSPTDSLSYNMSKLSVVHDSLGAQHTVTQYFAKNAGGGINVHYTVDGGAPLGTTTTLTFNTSGQLTAPAAPVALALTAAGAAAALTVNLDYTGTTQFAGEATTTTNSADGYASGTFTGVELAGNGSLIAQYTNGQKQTVGTVALATFPDEGSLTAVNDTSWTTSNSSGAPLYFTPGSGMAGSLTTSALEQSNVDITSELVGLMTSQRNYQANSKVISTESAMLQSLMQAL
ncbi:flagellar hook-basal body complex protein [Undibacterium sp.]|jgi:flagellar hook protein FlgE|uniref:flagellar hook protein FlgE n=1 Tax=Undibacterium sp. TaxID=1914977 RepID=UPI002C131ACE|nr:flagellar hook-basal body complex protein [Undibacterium sp.]HTD04151.1 flagellar hook-basal body complex protein [Undibacterium sp.]